jgi:hypothetical protein
MVSRIIRTSGRVNVWPAVVGTTYNEGYINLRVGMSTVPIMRFEHTVGKTVAINDVGEELILSPGMQIDYNGFDE